MQPSSEPHSSFSVKLTETTIREQLARILASETFLRSERLRAFLSFVVEEALAGRGDSLKEQVIAAALYRTRSDASSNDNSVVRADARRLRDKLREYYAEAAREPVLISLPKGTYTPVFANNDAAALSAPLPSNPEHTRAHDGRPAWAAALLRSLGVLVAVLGGALVWWNIRSSLPPQIVSLTQYPGGEGAATFSPDGNFIAFQHWDPPGPSAQDILVKAVRGDAVRRLTETPPPVAEHGPAWSPDGKEILFARWGWGQQIQNQGVFIVPAMGGRERKISESGRFPKWTPDGRSVLIRDGSPAAILQIDLTTLTRRQIVQAPSGDDIRKFDISSDGATLAFILSRRSGAADVFLVSMNGGEPQQLTNWGAYMDGVTWTPGGREIIYDVDGQSLWRISAQTRRPGKGAPVRGLESLVTAGAMAVSPSVSRPGAGRPARLAFQIVKVDISLRLIDLQAPLSGESLQVKPLLDSTRIDIPGPFSPDGEKIAYYSYLASFPAQFRVAKRDGSLLRQITSINAPRVRTGSWSQDGRQITFEAAVDGNSEIYTVSEDGGDPKRLTFDSATNITPSWSHDGRWIYYSSNSSGRYEVWRVPAEGGPPRQITRTGGVEPAESQDGKHIFYLEPEILNYENTVALPARLKVASVDGSGENVVLRTVRRGLWGVTTRGILFLTAERGFEAIGLYDFASGKVARIGQLPFSLPRRYPRLTFSRDGRWALANEVDRRESDLMMIENFQ